MNNIGRVHYRLGEHEKALQIYIKAYELRKDLLPKDHLDLAASAYNLAQTHHQLGNLDEGEFYAWLICLLLFVLLTLLTHIMTFIFSYDIV